MATTSPVFAQLDREIIEKAWKPLLDHQGVVFTYLFYPRADNYNNGIVIKNVNQNDCAVTYHFEAVFRAEDSTHVEVVDGRLEAGEGKTGSSAGLFWIPFKDGRSLVQFGLRGYRIEKALARPQTHVLEKERDIRRLSGGELVLVWNWCRPGQ